MDSLQTPEQTPDNQQRRGGWMMMSVGWGVAFLVAVLFFNDFLGRANNPNQLSRVQNQSGDTLVLDINRIGHYLVEGHINGEQSVFLLDTGASLVAVPAGVARRAGLSPGGTMRVQTANGIAIAHRTVIDKIQIGPLTFHNIKAAILQDGGDTVLLGMNALKQLSIVQKDGKLELR